MNTSGAGPSPEGLFQLGLGFWASKTFLSAVELGVFTALKERPLKLEALKARLGLHERSARDFLDALVALKVLQRDGEGVYANTPETALFLDRSKPTYVGGLFEMANARLYPFWGSLTEALRTGQPQNEVKNGRNLFTDLYADPKRLRVFLEGMTGVSASSGAAIAAKFPWAKVRTVIDIGVAQGAVPVQLALAHPHLTGGGFDLPVVGPIFEEYVKANGVADRMKFLPGDFFRDPLPQADVLIMGHILHDWDLGQKRALLAKAYASLARGGVLIVYDAMIDDNRSENAVGLLMSLNMLIETPGGFDYTGADCLGWMKEAGFRETRVEPLLGADSMAIGVK